MKALIFILIFSLNQLSCFAYNPYISPVYNQRLLRKGVITGIPAPIYQYNVQPQLETYYIKRKHIKKKYRKYYPSLQENQSFTIIEEY